MQIYLINDTSSSMTVLGKTPIVENLTKTIYQASLIDSYYSDIEFSVVNWNGKFEELNNLLMNQKIERALVLTDGYFAKSKDIKNFVKKIEEENKKCIFVHCGCDANINRTVYKAEDIMLALNEVCGRYEV